MHDALLSDVVGMVDRNLMLLVVGSQNSVLEWLRHVLDDGHVRNLLDLVVRSNGDWNLDSLLDGRVPGGDNWFLGVPEGRFFFIN